MVVAGGAVVVVEASVLVVAASVVVVSATEAPEAALSVPEAPQVVVARTRAASRAVIFPMSLSPCVGDSGVPGSTTSSGLLSAPPRR